MLDPELLAIAESADLGKACPPVNLMVGGNLMHGVPGCSDSATFVQAMWQPLYNDNLQSLHSKSKAERKADPLSPEERASQLTNDSLAVLGTSRADGGPALTLYWATLFTSGAQAFSVPAIRVAVDAVDAWWIAGQRPLGQAGGPSNGGWAVGVPVPIG